MEAGLLLIPLVALGRALLGWIENAFEDGTISLPEWKQLGATIVRMGTPMVALVWGLNISPEISAGIVTILDIVIVKIYNALKASKE